MDALIRASVKGTTLSIKWLSLKTDTFNHTRVNIPVSTYQLHSLKISIILRAIYGRSLMLTMQKRAYGCVLTQAAVLFLASLVIFLLSGGMLAKSVLLGGLAVVLPNLLMVKHCFSVTGARQAKRIVRGFYRGECLKIALTALLVALW